MRTTSIDSICKQFLQRYSQEPVQIISLGAGFDTRYFRILDELKPNNLASYFEIDLDSVTEIKQKIISETSELSQLQHRLKLVPVNLIGYNWEELGIHPSFDSSKPTLVIAECIFMYLPVNSINACLKYLSSFDKVELVTFDPICGEDRFGQQMIENLQDYGVDDESFRELKNIDCLKNRFTDCGFKSIKNWTLLDLETAPDSLHLVSKDARIQMQSKAALDEYEEWMLLAQHYVLTHAQR